MDSSFESNSYVLAIDEAGVGGSMVCCHGICKIQMHHSGGEEILTPLSSDICTCAWRS